MQIRCIMRFHSEFRGGGKETSTLSKNKTKWFINFIDRRNQCSTISISLIRDDAELYFTIKYVLMNQVDAGLVKN